MTELRFAGTWPLWLVVSVTLFAALAAFVLYRRELRRGWMGWLLPTLRALAIALVVMMLAGPELVHTTGESHRGQLLVLVDGSMSMGVRDEQMPLGEKLLAARRLGLTDLQGVDTSLAEAAQRLDSAAAAALDGASIERDAALAAAGVVQRVEEAVEAIAGIDPALAEQLRHEVADPARAISASAGAQDTDRVARDLAGLADPLTAWAAQLGQRFEDQLSNQGVGNAGVDEAVARFDALTRWERAQTLLLDLDRGVLPGLTENLDVQLVMLRGAEGRAVWSSADRSAMPSGFDVSPDAGGTDLSTEMLAALDRAEADDRLAIMLVTDGRQNQGVALSEAAEQARSRGAAVHSVALGSSRAPHDLAVVDIEHPPSVFPDDRVSGSVTLVDAMAAGQPYTLQVIAGEDVLWETQQVTIGDGQVRRVDFDFPIRAAADRAMSEAAEGVTVNQLAVPMQVRILGLVGDKEHGNDALDFQVRALIGQRKMLILAGRPRWEMRYIDSMFSRDPRWDVTTLMDLSDGGALLRSDDEGQEAFPATREHLFSYDIVVMGEVPPGVLNDRELTWLYAFVADRAGGMVVIDGRRGHLARFAETDLGPLLPTRRAERGRRAQGLVLTAEGARAPSLRLEPSDGANHAAWERLLPPSYLAPIDVVPGADTVLVEAGVGRDGEERWPVVLTRRVGAGWVWYSAMDETWRWRRDFESLYQERYWHQLTNRVVEPLYAAEDAFVSLGVDQVQVQSGQALPVRARIRDAQGRPRTSAEAVAHLTNMRGERVAQVALSPDAGEGGRFNGDVVADLPPGVYEVGISVSGVSEADLLAKTLITVHGGDEVIGELADLTVNLDLLAQAANATGGQVLREHQVDRIQELVEGLSFSNEQQTVSKLWQGWPWFGTVVLLLGTELFLRRRIGMI